MFVEGFESHSMVNHHRPAW